MAKVFAKGEGSLLVLAGREALEPISGKSGAKSVTMRFVEIPVPKPGELPRGPHVHFDFEECMYVISGRGVTVAESGDYLVKQGDTVLIPAGEKHATHNIGQEPLRLLCFFPVSDIIPGTKEFTSL